MNLAIQHGPRATLELFLISFPVRLNSRHHPVSYQEKRIIILQHNASNYPFSVNLRGLKRSLGENSSY